MDYEIVHFSERNRFEMEQDGLTAYVEYKLADGGLDILHTIVPEPFEGKGIAGALVKTAYDYALAQGLKAKATCSYAVIWLKRHPEYAAN
ncbi:GNAT family N-acetyltransferase [uncultured Bacteroides sp.]|uniref:GNAT family N-acetyltransferase n=1 Tax=uncultured Bacteroides sp. TaxID=162156 RepID=UPI002AA8A1D3|nr:GNAT family N-acetyltransferase [uncultured Bacteroides sp.]